MKITEVMILLIENALGLKLYEDQKQYLLGNAALVGARCTGKTTAYCIKLALSEGPALNMRKPEEFADGWNKPNQTMYARSHFRHEFLRIRGRLRDRGFPVRDIKNYDKVGN